MLGSKNFSITHIMSYYDGMVPDLRELTGSIFCELFYGNFEPPMLAPAVPKLVIICVKIAT